MSGPFRHQLLGDAVNDINKLGAGLTHHQPGLAFIQEKAG